MTKNEKMPSLLLSLVPLISLVVMMVINILIFKDDATGGPNQLALLAAGAIGGLIGVYFLKVDYKKIESEVAKSISMAMLACLILLIIGSVIGMWILSGVVPAIIYYGFKIITPAIFLPVACICCCIVSVATGSSWTTTGTVGIALLAIGKTYGLPEGMVAGAIISGAYFGDKMSPLSDTTNLAPAMAGTDLFTHIRHMTYTSVPAIVMAIIAFTVLGLFYQDGVTTLDSIREVSQIIESNFNIGVHLLLVPLIVLVMVAKKVPAIPALIVGILLGAVFALIFQRPLIYKMAGSEGVAEVYQTLVNILVSGFKIETGNSVIDSLFSRGGMSSMLSTVWLIICAMVFGGVLEGVGMLEKIASSILSLVRGTGSLVGATVASCIFTNMTASDQYVAIVVPGRMFRSAFEKYGLHPKNLSRCVEDAGTATSPLIPWNSCGAYESSVLGVATLTYAPFCFFNILSPIVSVFLASMNLTMEQISRSKDFSDEAEGDLATV